LTDGNRTGGHDARWEEKGGGMMKKFTAKQVEDQDTSILGYEQEAGEKTWAVIPILSLAKLEEKTQPRTNGLNDGQSNYPHAGDSEMSRTEKNILYEAESFLGKAKDFTNKYLTDIRRKMAAMADSGVADLFFDLRREPDKEFNKYRVTVDPELTRLRVEERKALRDLNRFKQDHQLQRTAAYPDSHVKHFAMVFLFLLGECIANTYFFAANSDLGYLGGFFQALVVSIANVGLSYIFAWLALTQLNHVRLIRKSIGIVSTVEYLCAVTAFHLLVAHYRDLLTIDPNNAIRLTLSRFSQNPFSFETLESIVVFVIGALISVLAAVKGYTHDDPYPGYGKVHRLHSDKEEVYVSKEMEARGWLVALLNDAEVKVNQRLAAREERIRKMEDLLNGARSVVAHIDNVDRRVVEVVNTAITAYREANKSVRTEAVPNYFATVPALKNKLDKGADILMLGSMEQVVADAKTNLDITRGKAKEALAGLFEESNRIGQIIEELADRVDRKAKDLLDQA
jgi:hypothetical protein